MRRTTRSSNLGRSKCPRRPTTHHSITHHHHHHHRRHHAHQPDPDLSLAGAPGPAIEPPSLPRASFFSPHTFLSDLSMIDVPPHYIRTFFLSFFSFVFIYPPGSVYPWIFTIACAYYKLCRWRSARPCATLTDSLCVIAVQRLDLTRHVTTPPPRHRRTPPHAIRNPLPLSTYPPAVAVGAATATAVAVAILLPLGAPVRHFHLHSK